MRVAPLDGLRGWAAIVVCVYHFGPELFRARYPVLDWPVFDIALNGTFAVALFFVLSGYVLTYGGWREPKAWVWRQMGKRYFRLAIPIIATTAIVFGLMALGFTRHHEASALLGDRGWWLQAMLDFEPAPDTALAYSAFWVFTPRGEFSYHPFLWTMPYELIGSFAVLLVCAFERGGQWSYYVLAVMIVAMMFILPAFATFPAGALLALAKKDGLIPDLGRWAWPVIAAGLVAASFDYGGRVTPLFVVAALACLWAAMSSDLTTALSGRVSQFLGRLSFPLYLMQFPVLVTVTSMMVVGIPLNLWTALLILLVSTTATVLAAVTFDPVERFAIGFSNRLVRRRSLPA